MRITLFSASREEADGDEDEDDELLQIQALRSSEALPLTQMR